jgi:WD40 repeat protein
MECDIVLMICTGLWDVLSNSGHESVQLFQPHVGPVNCTSVCSYNATKIYTTSHDGTVRCGDLNKLVFDQVSWYIPNLVLSYENIKSAMESDI